MKMDGFNVKNENKSDFNNFGTLIERLFLYLIVHNKVNNQINTFTT